MTKILFKIFSRAVDPDPRGVITAKHTAVLFCKIQIRIEKNYLDPHKMNADPDFPSKYESQIVKCQKMQRWWGVGG